MKILLVDDEERLVKLTSEALSEAGHRVTGVTSGEAAVRALDADVYDVVITDLRMVPVGGMEVLEHARKTNPSANVVILTGYGDVPTAVEAMKLGASDFWTKPFGTDELCLRLGRIAETRRLARDNAALRSELRSSGRFAEMVGESPALDRVRDLVAKVAPSDTTVLLLGESGVGKELVARMIHRRSPRAAKPFVVVHAAALPDTLLESELFGYERGAFTGATDRKPGRLEAAQGGTLFLDEIGEISPAFQVKLLRFLQERQFVRLGGRQTITVDARVVAATNRNLQEEAASGRFRDDLFYRLSVFPVEVPPLRERRSDIPLLAGYFLKGLGYNREPDRSVLALLAAHDWPGNVRELENVLERALILASGGEIRPQHIQLPEPVLARPESGALEEMERGMIEDAMRKAGGNKSKAAKLLGITRRMLYTKLEKLRSANDEGGQTTRHTRTEHGAHQESQYPSPKSR